MRLLPESATYTKLPATAIPPPGGCVGFCDEKKRNWPSPLPPCPHAVMKLPLESNFSIRLWLESTTYTSPAASAASPPMGPNWPWSAP